MSDPIYETEMLHKECNAEIIRLRASNAELLAKIQTNNEELFVRGIQLHNMKSSNAELVAALDEMLPGYEQYLEWAIERGVFFVKKNGYPVLERARAAIDVATSYAAAKRRVGA